LIDGLYEEVSQNEGLKCALFWLQPKFGGMIIDIVSRDVKTPEQQSESILAVRNAVIVILLIVVVG